MAQKKKTLLFFGIMTTLTIAIILLWALTTPLFTKSRDMESQTIWQRVQQLTTKANYGGK